MESLFFCNVLDILPKDPSVIITVLTIIGAAIYEIYARIKKRHGYDAGFKAGEEAYVIQKRNNEKMLTINMETFSKISYLIKEVREKCPLVTHTILMVGHNCGGLPNAGKPYYIAPRICDVPRVSELDKGAELIKNFNDDISVRVDDIIKLNAAITRGIEFVNIDEIDRSALSPYFKSHKIENVTVFYLDTISNNSFFLFIAKEGPEELTEEETSNVDSIIARLKTQLNK